MNTRFLKHWPLHSFSTAISVTAADVHTYLEMWWQPPSITVDDRLVAPYGACQPGDGVTSVSSATFWLSAAYPVTSTLSVAHSKPAQTAQLETWNYTPTLWLAAEMSTDWLMKGLQLYPLCYWLMHSTLCMGRYLQTPALKCWQINIWNPSWFYHGLKSLHEIRTNKFTGCAIHWLKISPFARNDKQPYF